MTSYAYPTPKPKRAWYRKPLVWTGIVVGLFALCGLGNLMANGGTPPPVQPNGANQVIGDVAQTATDAPAEVAAPPAPVTVTGTGNNVVQIGAVLNGTFQVDYSFGTWCGMAYFLNAGGESSAGIMEDINNCSGDTDTPMTGSTIVHLENTTTVRTDNTGGDWSLTFTSLS